MSADRVAEGMADLSFLSDLFVLFRPLRLDHDRAFGLDMDVEAGSALAGDDLAAKGYGPSILARQFIGDAADHEFAVETIVSSGHIGNSALWALLRCLLEAMAQAAYVLMPTRRDDRVAHALALSYHDYDMAEKYRKTLGLKPYSITGQPYLLGLAERRNIDPKAVTRWPGLGQIVGDAGQAIGMTPADARARWQEASAYSHGRNWNTLQLGTLDQADRMPGGWNVRVTMDEVKFRRIADLCTALARAVLGRYRRLAASPHRGLIMRLIDHRVSGPGGQRLWMPGLAALAVSRPSTCHWRPDASTTTGAA
jgi:hypothetical protein